MKLPKLIHVLPQIAFIILFFHAGTALADDTSSVDIRRNKLIGYMLYKQLPSIHFSDKLLDDTLSRAAYELYLEQLDFQKRFLLQKDVDLLDSFAIHIDDNLERGSIVLPETGFEILGERINQVEKMVDEIIATGFDVNREETYETDPEKLIYAKDLDGLRDKWRKMLKGQVISRYLDLVEEQEEKEEKEEKEKEKEKELWREAKEKVAKRNKDFFHRLHQETLQDHYDRYFNSITRAFDPHTTYMAPAKKEDFDIHMRGSLEGIGALLREEGGYIKVVRIIPGSASARQGRLAAEDVILQVAEGDKEPIEITDMRLRDAVRLIRGPKGTEVRLTVKKLDGTVDIIPIVRDVVHIEETFVKSTILPSSEDKKTGYVMIPSFYRDFEKTRNGDKARNSTDDTRDAILQLKKKGIDGMILDLRNNGGGSLVDAVDITGLFIEFGPVVQVKNSYGAKRVLNDEDYDSLYDGPLVVLVNQFSASASEILAAALQDYKRAVIVGGKHTHGKGTVQTILDMNENIPLLHLKRYDDLGALKVTIQKFYRINGGSTQYKGVEPDIVLPSLFQHLKSGEQYLDNSLPWGHVEPVEYTALGNNTLSLKAIRGKSANRVKNDEGLQIIAEEAQKAIERSKKTKMSLKLSDMKKKRKEAQLAREKVGAHFRNYQDEPDKNGDGFESETMDEKEKQDSDWVEEVGEDPYVQEAMNIVLDLKEITSKK